MSNELAVREPMRLSAEQLSYIKDTDFVPKSYRGNMPAILGAVATGREYGLGDMESLRLINVIDGKPELNAEGKLKLARRDGHSVTGTVTDEGATITGKRRDTGDEITVTYTLEDAKLAGLLHKDNWKKHPKEMLWARAVTVLCRRLFGDIVLDLPDVYEIESIAQAEEADALVAATEVPPVDVAALSPPEGGGDNGQETNAHPSPEPEPLPSARLEELAAVVITDDTHANYGMTLSEVLAMPRGKHWLAWCAGDNEHPQREQAAAYLEALA